VSHVLIYGQTPNVTQLKARLKGWGMSTGELIPGTDCPGRVSVDDCDAVILDLGHNAHPPWLHEFVTDSELAAPILILTNNEVPTLRFGGHWVELAGEEMVDARLLLELQGAIAHSRQKRGLGADAPGGSYLHFLGHELRSPLTAAKTALEALQGELSSRPDASEELQEADVATVETSLKMADIALRNIERLHQTVEWSQDLLAHMETMVEEEDTLESSILL